MTEYEKSQEEAVRHAIQEEYGPTTLVSDPMTVLRDTPALHHPSEGGARQVGPRGEGQMPEGPSWWNQLGDFQDDRQSRPQEGGTVDT